jgi:hypothetical protein
MRNKTKPKSEISKILDQNGNLVLARENTFKPGRTIMKDYWLQKRRLRP